MSREIQLSVYKNYYDAASVSDERDYGQTSYYVHEDAHFSGPARYIAIARMRREIRNNPYLAGMVGRFPGAIGNSGLRSRTSDDTYDALKETFWHTWSKSVTTAGDSLRQLEKIIWHELCVAGEVFLILQRNGSVQMVPSEFCGSPYSWMAPTSGNSLYTEINGIQITGDNRPVAYRFGTLNNYGGIDYSDDNSTLVPAKFVIHIYNKDRILMGRGLPWLLASITPARDLYEITRSKTKQIKDVTNVCGFLSKTAETPGFESLQPMTVEELSQEISGEDPETAPAEKVSSKTQRIELKPGTFIELNPGEKLEQLTTQYQASDYKELIMTMLHTLSTPIGFPVELWFSGLGDVNYSGFKGLGTQWASKRGDYTAMMEEKALEPLHNWRIDKARNEGDLPRVNKATDDSLHDWRWRRAAVLDDEKQAKSFETRLKSGESTLMDIWEEDGKFADEELMKRRKFYITALRISDPSFKDQNEEEIVVPLQFLLSNTLPGVKSPFDTTDQKQEDNNANEGQENKN